MVFYIPWLYIYIIGDILMYCKLVWSKCCVTTDVYFVRYFWCRLSLASFYTGVLAMLHHPNKICNFTIYDKDRRAFSCDYLYDIKYIMYRWTSLYARDRDSKYRLTYNEFAYKKTQKYHKLEDRFQEKGHFSIEFTRNCR